MSTQRLTRYKWFWAWQDEKEETWLESMSQQGWHLESVQLPCIYTFRSGEPINYTYRLDYMTSQKTKWEDYIQIFQDAGWEYLGEMSNWRYWRKLAAAGETPEIFTDAESKIKKYTRIISVMGFFLVFLVIVGFNTFLNPNWPKSDRIPLITAIYLVGRFLYAVLIPIYIFVVAKIAIRINQLKKKRL